jgi:hypothetical protein
MHRVLVRALVAVVAALSLAFGGLALAQPALAHPATAKPDKGSTRVAVAPRVAKIITAAGITPSTTGPAKAFAFQGTVALRFPITKVAGNGNRIKHIGGVVLSAGSVGIKLSRFSVNLKTGTVSAKVNHDARAVLFNIEKSHRPKLGAARLTFNKTSAGALNGTFGVDVFAAGGNFGFATVHAK